MLNTSDGRRARQWIAIARSSRGIARTAGAIVRGRGSPVVPTFWCDDRRNFGDQLTPWLLRRYHLYPVLADPTKARLAGVGSILDALPSSFDGAIWGSGLIEDKPHPLPLATILSVRGSLTASHLGTPDSVTLGDPGILVARHVPRGQVGPMLGLVPHKTMQSSWEVRELASRYPSQIRVIDVRQGPTKVAHNIASCSGILTSSLHGLVVADSYSIPAAWFAPTAEMRGGDFKFRDYETSLGSAPSRRVSLRPEDALKSIMASLTPVHKDQIHTMASEIERSLCSLGPSFQRIRSAS